MNIVISLLQRIPTLLKEHLLGIVLLAVATGVVGNFVYDAIKPQPTSSKPSSQAEALETQPAPPKTERLYVPSDSITSLECRGQWLLTHEGKTTEGTQGFRLTLDLGRQVGYLFAFVADGSHSRTHAAMNEEIRSFSSLTDDAVQIGELQVDRRTLKYTHGMATSGICRVLPQIEPIPQRKF